MWLEGFSLIAISHLRTAYQSNRSVTSTREKHSKINRNEKYINKKIQYVQFTDSAKEKNTYNSLTETVTNYYVCVLEVISSTQQQQQLRNWFRKRPFNTCSTLQKPNFSQQIITWPNFLDFRANTHNLGKVTIRSQSKHSQTKIKQINKYENQGSKLATNFIPEP